jgi:CDGSH-type Zn-finger protein
MDKSVIAGRLPLVTKLEPGEYWWCACGRSKDQPYCDGSHEGTSFAPVQFVIDKSKKVALCLCKQTAKRPFCDGTHTKLKE